MVALPVSVPLRSIAETQHVIAVQHERVRATATALSSKLLISSTKTVDLTYPPRCCATNCFCSA